MSDLQLFRLSQTGVTQIKAETVALEKSLQTLIEKHLEALVGVRFLASEYGTGKKHGGRIDTLGLDENGFPVIIEFKRQVNENVINQGLFYLDWLLDHQAEFQLLVMDRLGADVAQTIDWTGPRLLCIAGAFTRYDEHAVQQINRNIELIRYARYGDDLLMLDLVNRTEAKSSSGDGGAAPKSVSGATALAEDLIAKLTPPLSDVHSALHEYLVGLGSGEEVTANVTKIYVAYRRLKNFACMRPTSSHLAIWTKVDPDSISLDEGFTRDVRQIGHYGTGDLEVLISDMDDLERAKPLLLRAFEDN